MRILFSAVPAYGHLLPMIPLARAAERAGHEVVVSTGSELSGVLSRRGLRHHRAGPAWSIPSPQRRPPSLSWPAACGGR